MDGMELLQNQTHNEAKLFDQSRPILHTNFVEPDFGYRRFGIGTYLE